MAVPCSQPRPSARTEYLKKIVQRLELCSEVDLKALKIWKAGEEAIQKNILTKFVRHILGIGNGEVNWDSILQVKATLDGRVRN